MMHPFAVVCQQQQSLGVEVEPTDGIDALAAVFDELGDGLSPFFVIMSGSGPSRERGLPSTVMRSESGSAFWPMNAVSPFTHTRPAAIHCSAVRREQSPASAISF